VVRRFLAAASPRRCVTARLQALDLDHHAGEPPPDFVATHAAAENGKAVLQDLFLAAATRDSERMTLFLVNGVMLQGTVVGFDQFSLILERGGQIQLVYKHALSTLQPAHPLNLEPEQVGQPEDES
jgi:host factor-I protein